MPLIEATDDTLALISAVTSGLRNIFRAGFHYKKVGVMLTLLSSKTARQGTLFDEPAARGKSARLMAVMDAVNQEFGRDTLHSAAEGVA